MKPSVPVHVVEGADGACDEPLDMPGYPHQLCCFVDGPRLGLIA